MDKNILINILKDQKDLKIKDPFVNRTISEKIKDFEKNKCIIIISGIRRCGKSTLLREIKNNLKADYFFNFDDDRLIDFNIKDFQKLYELFLETYDEQQIFLFDEIQNIKGWESFVRRLHDYDNKIYITGSNSTMLSKELGTRLTGRYIKICLFPFSFKEFLIFKKYIFKKQDLAETKVKAKIKNFFNEYFKLGGFPEFLKNENPEYLKNLNESIIYRDVLVKHKISNEKIMKELVFFVASNVGKELSFNSVKKLLGLGSSTTIKEYFDFLEESYLLFLVPKFDYSLKKQVFSNKKVYFIDLALARIVGFRISSDNGRLLENLVFIELKRREHEIYYHREQYECDFLIKEGVKITQAIQVTTSLKNIETKKREFSGLLECMKKYKLNTGLILTEDEENVVKIKNKVITIMPVWKWLLI